jgi:hypothetical protein
MQIDERKLRRAVTYHEHHADIEYDNAQLAGTHRAVARQLDALLETATTEQQRLAALRNG